MSAALLLAAALAASSPSAMHGKCFNFGGGNSTHYFPVNNHTILVSAGVHAYRITVTPTALLSDPAAVINVSFPISSPVVCSPQDLTLRVTSPSGRSGLIVQDIAALSRAEAERLRGGLPRRR